MASLQNDLSMLVFMNDCSTESSSPMVILNQREKSRKEIYLQPQRSQPIMLSNKGDSLRVKIIGSDNRAVR